MTSWGTPGSRRSRASCSSGQERSVRAVRSRGNIRRPGEEFFVPPKGRGRSYFSDPPCFEYQPSPASLRGPGSVNSQILIDAIVRQTMVLIAQLSTADGVRSPLAHVADEVFVGLVHELERQNVGKKVIADMFGLALRSY